jgi:hypothetical protein
MKGRYTDRNFDNGYNTPIASPASHAVPLDKKSPQEFFGILALS